MAEFNFYNVHYLYTHVVGTSGGNTSDMKEAIEMMTSGRLNPATMLTHIGGLNAVVDTTLNLPNIKGGKKLIYTQIELPLTAIADFEKLGESDPLFAKLAEITARTTASGAPRRKNTCFRPRRSADTYYRRGICAPVFSVNSPALLTRGRVWFNY